MKPIIILPPDAMSDENIKLLRENDLCVVVAKDPTAVKFVDPIPTISSRSEMEAAAIKFARRIFAGHLFADSRPHFAKLYLDCLIEGTPLGATYIDPKVVEKGVFDTAKQDELKRLAREEAKSERAAAKAKEKKPA